MDIAIYASADGRIRTAEYKRDGAVRFCLAESIADGTLITEFDSRGEVVNQVCRKSVDPVAELRGYLGIGEGKVTEAGKYDGIVIRARCKGCGAEGLRRELDIVPPPSIKEVPVVPIFVCNACRKRHYSLTDSYLGALVDGNRDLFEDSEGAELDRDRDASLAMLQAYIIRIFASKRISRVEIT